MPGEPQIEASRLLQPTPMTAQAIRAIGQTDSCEWGVLLRGIARRNHLPSMRSTTIAGSRLAHTHDSRLLVLHGRQVGWQGRWPRNG
jgi:hypothetical protein